MAGETLSTTSSSFEQLLDVYKNEDLDRSRIGVEQTRQKRLSDFTRIAIVPLSYSDRVTEQELQLDPSKASYVKILVSTSSGNSTFSFDIEKNGDLSRIKIRSLVGQIGESLYGIESGDGIIIRDCGKKAGQIMTDWIKKLFTEDKYSDPPIKITPR